MMQMTFKFLLVPILLLIINLSFIHSFGEYLKEDDEHNDGDYEFDHHVILGRGQAAIFNKLSPEESKARLSVIIDQMDLNHDGKIDLPELKSWIQKGFNKILEEDVDEQWNDIVKTDVDKINFQSYVTSAFKGGVEGDKQVHVEFERRRWNEIDSDKDNLLNKTELFRFMHPEEFKDLKPLLAQESLDELDKNHNGFVDLEEYLDDMFPKGREVKDKWVQHERENFANVRDLNKDGQLDRAEIQNWLLPDSYDRVTAEAERIMDKADAGSDNVLTKSQILEKYYVFVGSDTSDDSYSNREDL